MIERNRQNGFTILTNFQSVLLHSVVATLIQQFLWLIIIYRIDVSFLSRKIKIYRIISRLYFYNLSIIFTESKKLI